MVVGGQVCRRIQKAGVHLDIRLLGCLLGFDVFVNFLDQGLASLARERRDFKNRTLEFEALDKVFDQRRTVFRSDHIELVEHQPARLFVQGIVVLFQLIDDRLGLGHRVHTLVKWRNVHNVQQQAGALQVAQEQVPQARTLRGAFDQTRQISHHETLLRPYTHHA